MGQAKTRLVGLLDEEQVAALYDSFLRDTLARAAQLADCQVVLAYTPPEARDRLQEFTAGGVRLLVQPDGDLGQRMHGVFQQLFAEGTDAVVMIGADLPTLPRRRLDQAFTALEESDVVLGPSLDGGYYLLGLRAAQPGLFRGVAWSTAAVLGQTVERMEQLALSVRCLDPWYDVDTVDHLGFLVAHLRLLLACDEPDLPRATVRTLTELGLLSPVGPVKVGEDGRRVA